MVSNETAKVSMFGLTLDRSLFHTFFPPSACLFPQLLQHSAPHHLQGAALVLFSSFFPTLHTLGFRRRLLTEAPES